MEGPRQPGSGTSGGGRAGLREALPKPSPGKAQRTGKELSALPCLPAPAPRGLHLAAIIGFLVRLFRE